VRAEDQHFEGIIARFESSRDAGAHADEVERESSTTSSSSLTRPEPASTT
jgi:hypothetical protein